MLSMYSLLDETLNGKFFYCKKTFLLETYSIVSTFGSHVEFSGQTDVITI